MIKAVFLQVLEHVLKSTLRGNMNNFPSRLFFFSFSGNSCRANVLGGERFLWELCSYFNHRSHRTGLALSFQKSNINAAGLD